jgi:hypothetical protein
MTPILSPPRRLPALRMSRSTTISECRTDAALLVRTVVGSSRVSGQSAPLRECVEHQNAYDSCPTLAQSEPFPQPNSAVCSNGRTGPVTAKRNVFSLCQARGGHQPVTGGVM